MVLSVLLLLLKDLIKIYKRYFLCHSKVLLNKLKYNSKIYLLQEPTSHYLSRHITTLYFEQASSLQYNFVVFIMMHINKNSKIIMYINLKNESVFFLQHCGFGLLITSPYWLFIVMCEYFEYTDYSSRIN